MLLYHLVVGQILSSPEPLYALYRLIVTSTPLRLFRDTRLRSLVLFSSLNRDRQSLILLQPRYRNLSVLLHPYCASPKGFHRQLKEPEMSGEEWWNRTETENVLIVAQSDVMIL